MLSAFLKKVKKDRGFRIKLFLLLSFIFNFAYAVFLFVISQIYLSKWFFVMSVYYGLLSATRFFVFLRSKPEETLRKRISLMRTVGIFLLLQNVAVSAMMFVLIYTTNYVKHHSITVITLAAYTFFVLTMGIITSAKHLKKNDYTYSCIKVISLISASVSMVTLTNMMLATFGEENAELRSIILPILSGVVSIFIVVCAIYMIKKANHDVKVLKDE